jgi:tetratricopeptide (TPR) repeat protein
MVSCATQFNSLTAVELRKPKKSIAIIHSSCGDWQFTLDRTFGYREKRNDVMTDSRVPILHRRVEGGRPRLWNRGLRVAAVGVTSALLLSACGSGSGGAQSIDQNLTAGIAAQNAGNYASATTYYEKVLAVDKTNATALYDLGDVDQLQNLDADARARYLAALAVDPNFISAMYNLATIEANTSPNNARVLYLQIIKLQPSYANAHFNLGYVLLSLGQKQAGLNEINEGIRLDPSLKSRVETTTTTTPRSTTTTTKAP